MITTKHRNDIRAITSAAAAAGIKLPGSLAVMAAHLDDLEQATRTARTGDGAPSHATALLDHLGDPAGMDKALTKAAAVLAAEDARARISTLLVDKAAVAVRSAFGRHADDILDAFAPATQAATDTLNAEAAKLPEGFRAAQAASLPPATYTAWSAARDAEQHLRALGGPLGTLYAAPASDYLPSDAIAALRYVEPPEFTDYQHAVKFSRALAGVIHGGSNVGPVNITGVFAPTAVAHLGATFQWANNRQALERAERVLTALTPPNAALTVA